MPKVTVIQLLNGKPKTMDIRYAEILVRLGRVRFQDTIIQKCGVLLDKSPATSFAIAIPNENAAQSPAVNISAGSAPDLLSSINENSIENNAAAKNSLAVPKQKPLSKSAENSQEK